MLETAVPLAPGVTPLATAPGDVYEFVVRGTTYAGAVQCTNVLHFLALTPGCTATALIADFRANCETEWRNVFPTGYVINRYLAFNLIPFQTDVAEQNVSLAGTNGSIEVPSVVAAIVTWRTAQMGRRKRGRTYFGPVNTADVSNGRLINPMTTGKHFVLATKLMARYGPTGTSSDSRLCIWSRVLGNQTPPHSSAGATLVNSFTVQSALGSMGTRRVGRGP